ncbi:MAG: rhomboid family intramembrane serine protease [Pseudomonadota bacterium]
MNQPIFSRRRSGNSAVPDAVFLLLITNALVFASQQMATYFTTYHFALWPIASNEPPFAVWQLLTYGWMHADMTHIAFNMFGLWMFGSDLERLWGPQRFIIFYLVCVAGAGIIQLLVAAYEGGIYPTVGASGGLFGILLAYGLTFPNRVVVPLFPPIPMRAITFVFVFGALELFLGISGAAPGIANFAHVGGMLFGFLMLQFWKRPRRR